MKSPILFIIFKRTDTTKQVFERIREVRPPRLYVAADGPRPNRHGEAEACENTRKIIEQVDWPCQVYKLFQDQNLGCGKGVVTALSWFFSKEEEGIILEDDILPHVDFFRYCDEMLERYRNDESIQMICGHNVFYDGINHTSSYYMSSFMQIWGWASWRRVWKTYEYNANYCDGILLKQKLKKRIPHEAFIYFMEMFRMMKKNAIDTWDYQMYFNQILYDRYSVISYVNLTENIGFGSMNSAHTTGEYSIETKHKAQSPYPITHIDVYKEDKNADYVNMINLDQYVNNYSVLLRMRIKYSIKNFAKRIGLFDILYNIWVKYKK